MKRKVSKGVKRRLIVFGPISLIIIFFVIASISTDLYKLYNLTQRQKELEKEITILKEKQENLELELGRLQDPDYIARFARENFLYSKEGEYIIRIDRDSDSDEENESLIDEDTKKGVGISIGIISVLGVSVLLVKKRKANKKKK